METSVKQRLIEFIKYKDLSQRKFEQLVGLSNGFVNNISKGIGADKMLKILSVFPELNQRWLLYNEGSMLQKNEASPRTMDVIVGIPLVSQYAYAGYLSGYGDPEYIDKLPRIDFTPDRHMTGNYIAFEVRGDSMNDGSADSYLEGELLICREVEPVYWKDSQLFIN